MTKPRVFLAVPNGGNIRWETACALMNAKGSGDGGGSWELAAIEGQPGPSQLSLTFNQLWCKALNARDALSLTHFAMIHADIAAEGDWIGDLLAEQAKAGADIISCVIPLKDERGLTSTGFMDMKAQATRRVSMTEAYELPETFDATHAGRENCILLPNTGLFVCDFTKEWPEKFLFTITDRISRDNAGIFHADSVTEDWLLGMRAAMFWKLKVAATRAVKLHHFAGGARFHNHYPWGTVERETFEGTVAARATDLLRIRGWLTTEEGRFLSYLARDKQVLEIGSYCGLSTIYMAKTAAKVVAVDTFDGRHTNDPQDTLDEFQANVEAYGVASKVVAMQGTSEHIVPHIGMIFDFAFIDGAHDYASVRTDARLAKSVLSHDGLLAFHDYQRAGDEGVTQAVDEMLADGATLVDRAGSIAVVRPVGRA